MSAQISVCREHHYLEFPRCVYCQIQRRYYNECMATLNSWPTEEKKTEEWTQNVERLQCRGRV